MPIAEGKTFDFNDVSHIDTNVLETFDFEDNQEIKIENPEFSAVCPFSGLPDIATVTIVYYPKAGKAIELKSLKYYFNSFRSVGIYQEAVTKRIAEDLASVLKTEVYVKTVYNTRGGLNVTCLKVKREEKSV